MRLKTGGRLDFWSLENPIPGRGRGYQRVVIDEAAFTRNGDNKTVGAMMNLWESSIKPTLYDYGGEALACSNAAGKDPDNFFYISALIHSTGSMNTTRRPWTIRFYPNAYVARIKTLGCCGAPSFKRI